MNTQECEVEPVWREFRRSRSIELRNALVERYMPLVKVAAERVWSEIHRMVELEELKSVAVLGLIEAVDGYDIDRGVKFETYCASRLRGAILDELRSRDWLPRLTRAKVQRATEADQRLRAHLGRAPTEEEIAEGAGLTMEEYDEIFHCGKIPSSVSLTDDLQRFDDGSQFQRIRILEDKKEPDPLENVQSREARRIVMEVVRTLRKPERLVVQLYYYEQLTMKQIGSLLGISESRVSQIHAEVVELLKRRMKTRDFEMGSGET